MTYVQFLFSVHSFLWVVLWGSEPVVNAGEISDCVTMIAYSCVELQRVVTVPAYTLSLLASVLSSMLLAGYQTNAARFVQLQFGYDYQHAWFYTNGLYSHSIIHIIKYKIHNIIAFYSVLPMSLNCS